MSASSKWKSKLISSSLPLEFEAAKILVSERFAITSDFTYARNDSGIIKDFSVDLHARGYPPFASEDEIFASLELLIECKQRRSDISWLFLPDPNRGDFSPITLGCTIRAVDEFSMKFFPPNVTVPFDYELPFCYKGTEIDISNGEIKDSELKHGIAQLQYALPRLLTESIIFSVNSHPNDMHPFLFCPILLTTSNLFIANKDLITKDIENSSTLNDIATEVPYLGFVSDYGPDFETHCIKECADLADLLKLKSVKIIQDYRKSRGEYEISLPANIGMNLACGRRYELLHNFSQFVICTMDSFPTLVTQIKEIAERAASSLE